MDYQTPLAKVRGLGPAKAGTGHFWMQRITAITLIPLSLWMVSFTEQLLDATHQEIIIWLSGPLDTILALAWIIAAFYHAALGMQVIFEDYIGHKAVRVGAIMATNLLLFLLGAAAIIAVIRIALGG